MVFTTPDRRAWVKRISRKAAENGIALKTQLETDLDAAVDGVATGEINSVSGNGIATTFASSASSLNPSEIVRLLNNLDDLYDTAKAEVIRLGTASPSDAEIVTEMLLELKAVRRMGGDFTALRTT